MPVGNPNGYGGVALNAMGGHTQRTPGQRFMSPVNAGAQMTAARMRQAQQSATASITRMSNDPTRIRGTKPRSIASRSTDNMRQYTRRPAGSPLGAMQGPPKPIPPRHIPNVNPKGKLLSNKGLMIGAGAAVIAGLAMNRRGDGTSSGRSGMTRY